MVKKIIVLLVIVSTFNVFAITNVSLAKESNKFNENKNLIVTDTKNIEYDKIQGFNDTANIIGISEKYVYFSNEEYIMRYNFEDESVKSFPIELDYVAWEEYLIHDILYIVYLDEEEGISFDLKKYDFDEETIIVYSQKSTSFPYVTVSEHKIYLTFGVYEDDINTFTKFRSSLIVLDIDDLSETDRTDFSYMQNNDGNVVGERIVFSGLAGEFTDDKLILQTVTPNNEMAETSKDNNLYFIKDFKEYNIIKTDDIYDHVNLVEDLLLTSIYCYEIPLPETGIIKRITDNDLKYVHGINGIESVASIVQSKVYKDKKIAFDNRKSIYFYDMENNEYCLVKGVSDSSSIYYADKGVYISYIDEKNLVIEEVRWQ